MIPPQPKQEKPFEAKVSESVEMMRTLIPLYFLPWQDLGGGGKQCHNKSFCWKTSCNSPKRRLGTTFWQCEVEFHILPPGEIPPVAVEDEGSFQVQWHEKSSGGN